MGRSPCLQAETLSAFLDGELTEASTELIRRHLSECGSCTMRFARIEAQEEIMARILVDEPDDDFFRNLAASLGTTRSAGGDDLAPSAPTPRAAGTPTPRRREWVRHRNGTSLPGWWWPQLLSCCSQELPQPLVRS